MEKHRALIIGAGRIGAGFNWHDDAYTHAGAYRALKNRVELVGFVEPNPERGDAAEKKWKVLSYESVQEALTSLKPSIVSVCTQPEDQIRILPLLDGFDSVKGIWCEKPYMGYEAQKPVQVNYLRRGDPFHRDIRSMIPGGKLIVYGKDDLTTRCHFDDLALFWSAELDYRPFPGPCAYVYERNGKAEWFDAGGVDAGYCMKSMLNNLLDHVDNQTSLWSPAR